MEKDYLGSQDPQSTLVLEEEEKNKKKKKEEEEDEYKMMAFMYICLYLLHNISKN
jgi:hypothetical protein